MQYKINCDPTSVIGMPKQASGYGVDEGTWLPWRNTIACLLFSSAHIELYFSWPM
jgi:hypothetical protein